jgi:hypothetical protein
MPPAAVRMATFEAVVGRRVETRRSRGWIAEPIRGVEGTPKRGDRFLPWGAAFFCWALSTVLAWERA